jgi:hypothetical protein
MPVAGFPTASLLTLLIPVALLLAIAIYWTILILRRSSHTGDRPACRLPRDGAGRRR